MPSQDLSHTTARIYIHIDIYMLSTRVLVRAFRFPPCRTHACCLPASHMICSRVLYVVSVVFRLNEHPINATCHRTPENLAKKRGKYTNAHRAPTSTV